MSERESKARSLLQAQQQEHVFKFFDSLSNEEQDSLLTQVESIDFELLDKLSKKIQTETSDQESLTLEPAPIITLPNDEKSLDQHEAARKHGEELIRSGKVAAFVVAGGQGSRLGLDGPKGAFEVGPVSDRSLFQIHAEKIIALGRRYGSSIPFLIMTSQANHDATESFFKKHNYFGMDPKDVLLFPQAMIPAIDRDGKLLLEEKGKIFTSPNGHGGSLQALKTSGALEELKTRGIDTIFYFQVDNPLVQICDPTFIGFHHLEGAEMSSKVVRKRDWSEKVGVIGKCNGTLTVIEYSDLSTEEAQATNDKGELEYWAGSVAIHVISTDFIERLNQGGLNLPYHKAEKSIPYIDSEGNKVRPTDKNGIKFETFVFDALGQAKASITLEAKREEEFSPVKNAEGEDSPQTCRQDLTLQYLRFLKEAGADVTIDDFDGFIEISPLKALDSNDLAGVVGPDTKIEAGFTLA